jgi:LysM repeat protein
MTGLCGPNPPKIVSGYGGWEVINRPRKRGTIEWGGVEPLRMRIDFLLDAWGYDTAYDNVNDAVEILDTMASPVKEGVPPPIVRVTGSTVPRGRDVQWVIEELDWGDTIYNTEGDILRQEALVTLLQADAAEHLRKLSPSKKRQQRPKPRRSGQPVGHVRGGVYRWKKGDTFGKLAERFMGGAKYAAQLMRFNNIRDPKTVRVGDIIRFP